MTRRLKLDEGNALVSEEHYSYKDSILVKYTNKYSSSESQVDVIRIYDEKGRLTEWHDLYSYDNKWIYKYYFEGELKTKAEYFNNGKLVKREYFQYE